MKLLIHRKRLKIRKVIVFCSNLHTRREDEIPLIDLAAQPENDPGMQSREIIVDENVRRNANV